MQELNVVLLLLALVKWPRDTVWVLQSEPAYKTVLDLAVSVFTVTAAIAGFTFAYLANWPQNGH